MLTKALYTSLLFLVTTWATGQNQWKDVYTEGTWAERDRWQRAGEIIRHLSLKTGSSVADIGAHEGYFTFKLAKTIGNTGRVYAVDISEAKLRRVKEIARQRNVTNVVAIHGEKTDPKLPANVMDAVLIVDTYHEMDETAKMLSHIKVALKKNGRLVICEPISEERKKLGRLDQENKHELGINFAIDDLKKAGFRVIYQQEDFVDRREQKGDTMWIVVATKQQ